MGHGMQPEILEYMHRVTDKYSLCKHCCFQTSLDKAEWDAEASVWRIETRNVCTGKKQMTSATVLVSAIGVLVVPKFPKLQGIESFKGEVFHSACWRHKVDDEQHAGIILTSEVCVREERSGDLANGRERISGRLSRLNGSRRST
jgi:cation diffusion facilitator CzcD-associated flavoprotein CzcO